MQKKVITILPGLIASFVIAVISHVIAIWLPQLGAATIAILLGILLGNTLIKSPTLQTGTKFSESRLLEYSVVLLGATITFQTIAQIGWQGILMVVLQMSIVIICAILIGKKLAFNEGTYLMMAGGNAVCGSSAIASIAPVIEADDEDKGLVITIINLMGTVMMLILPLISLGLYHHEPLKTGAMMGGTLQSVGQVVASASMVSVHVTQMATLFKIMRIIMLVVVVLIFGRMHQRHAKESYEQENQEIEKTKINFMPWYVIGFFVLCILNSLHLIPTNLQNIAHFISGWFEVIALAAIGLRLNLHSLLSQGKRFAIYSLSLGSIEIISVIALIALLKI